MPMKTVAGFCKHSSPPPSYTLAQDIRTRIVIQAAWKRGHRKLRRTAQNIPIEMESIIKP